jgi:hypothetical protein
MGRRPLYQFRIPDGVCAAQRELVMVALMANYALGAR